MLERLEQQNIKNFLDSKITTRTCEVVSEDQKAVRITGTKLRRSSVRVHWVALRKRRLWGTSAAAPRPGPAPSSDDTSPSTRGCSAVEPACSG